MNITDGIYKGKRAYYASVDGIQIITAKTPETACSMLTQLRIRYGTYWKDYLKMRRNGVDHVTANKVIELQRDVEFASNKIKPFDKSTRYPNWV